MAFSRLFCLFDFLFYLEPATKTFRRSCSLKTATLTEKFRCKIFESKVHAADERLGPILKLLHIRDPRWSCRIQRTTMQLLNSQIVRAPKCSCWTSELHTEAAERQSPTMKLMCSQRNTMQLLNIQSPTLQLLNTEQSEPTLQFWAVRALQIAGAKQLEPLRLQLMSSQSHTL